MNIETLSEKQFQALESLATYRYLTAKQFVALGVAASVTVARDHILPRLEKGRKPFAKAHNPGRHIGFGQLPYIHFLTEHGANALAEYHRIPVADIIYPKGGVQFQRDIHHRIGVIDCHIQFRQWAESQDIELTIADMYFDKVGSQRFGGQTSRTHVKMDNGNFIEPDAIFGYRQNEQDYLYALEYHRTPDVGRIVEQLLKHAECLKQGAIAKKYGLQVSNYVLSVHDTTKEAVVKRLGNYSEFQVVREAFVFERV